MAFTTASSDPHEISHLRRFLDSTGWALGAVSTERSQCRYEYVRSPWRLVIAENRGLWDAWMMMQEDSGAWKLQIGADLLCAFSGLPAPQAVHQAANPTTADLRREALQECGRMLDALRRCLQAATAEVEASGVKPTLARMQALKLDLR